MVSSHLLGGERAAQVVIPEMPGHSSYQGIPSFACRSDLMLWILWPPSVRHSAWTGRACQVSRFLNRSLSRESEKCLRNTSQLQHFLIRRSPEVSANLRLRPLMASRPRDGSWPEDCCCLLYCCGGQGWTMSESCFGRLIGHSRWYLFRTHSCLSVKHWAGVSHSLLAARCISVSCCVSRLQ